MSTPEALTPPASIRLLADCLDHTAANRGDVRLGILKAFGNAEMYSKDEACLAACDAACGLFARLAEAYEATAKAFDERGGSIVCFADIEIKSACVRLEARVAQWMPGSWMQRQARHWRDLAHYLETDAEKRQQIVEDLLGRDET